MGEIFTVEQTAEYLQICSKTVRKLIHLNKLGATKVGKAWRIPKEEIDDYLVTNSNREKNFSKGGSYNEQ
jgi:excisionase family DNA binding protein